MVKREYWIKRIEEAWRERTVVWLGGVRRAGKTFLCHSLKEVEYFDCERPSDRRTMEDADSFLDGLRGRRVVVDEIHRLSNPAELLKIAADHHPDVRVIATGSSMLGAAARFRDTLTGRKRDVRLTPMNSRDLKDFGRPDWRHRLLRGGLPPFLLSKGAPDRDFDDWLDAFWAKDIQDLFRLERRASFLKFFELVLAQSGSIFTAFKFARPCEVSHTTIANYLAVLETTLVVTIVRPFSSGRTSEIIAAPRVYGFDTGFVCHARGWSALRDDDLGILWEHAVLNELSAARMRKVKYWRDKQGHEVDFVIDESGRPPTVIECKWTADRFDPAGFLCFRRAYPAGTNLVVAHDVSRPYTRRFGGLAVRFAGIHDVAAEARGKACDDR